MALAPTSYEHLNIYNEARRDQSGRLFSERPIHGESIHPVGIFRSHKNTEIDSDDI